MTKIKLGLVLSAFLAGALPAFAETAAGDVFIPAQKLTEYLAKDRLIGANVKNSEGAIIGDIEDLIIDNDDHVSGVIMGVGGFLGIGEKKVAVKASALQLEVTDGKMNVLLPAATKDALKAAPAYQRATPKKGLLERVTDKARELKEKSAETAKDAYQNAKEKAGPAVENAKKEAGEAYEKAKKEASEAYEKAMKQAGESYDKAKKEAGEAVEKAKEGVKDAVDKAKDAAKPTEAPKQ